MRSFVGLALDDLGDMADVDLWHFGSFLLFSRVSASRPGGLISYAADCSAVAFPMRRRGTASAWAALYSFTKRASD